MLTLIKRVVEKEEKARLRSRGLGKPKKFLAATRTYWLARCGCGKVIKVRADNIATVRGCSSCQASRSRLTLETWLVRTVNYIRTKSFRPCAYCGELYIPAAGQNYCGRACRQEACAEALKKAVAVCRICDQEFKPVFFQQATCSFYCKRLNDKRRVLPRALSAPLKNRKESFDPISILNRDSWVCQVCTFPAPKHLRGTYSPIAPEVGHIVPHAQGGDYVPANLQCEHRSCNLAKNYQDQL